MVSLYQALLRTCICKDLYWAEIAPFLEMRTTFVRTLSFVCLCDGVHYDDEGPSCKSSIALGVERQAFAYASLLFSHTFTN